MEGLVAWWCQVINWTYVDLLSVRSRIIHRKAIALEMPMKVISTPLLKIEYLKSEPHVSEDSDLHKRWFVNSTYWRMFIAFTPFSPFLSYLFFRNILWPTQNGRHYPDDIWKGIFLNENVWISIKISLNFVGSGLIKCITALVKIMAWRQPAASHYLNQWWWVYWRIYASLCLTSIIVEENIFHFHNPLV